jgi:polysaccharide export outer membrane protein
MINIRSRRRPRASFAKLGLLAVGLLCSPVTTIADEYKPIRVSGTRGFQGVNLRANSALREAIQLQAEYASLWVSFAKEQVHIWRIKSELGDSAAFDQSVFKDAPISQATLSEMLSVETQHLNARRADYEREKASLHRAVGQADKHIAVLTKQQKTEEEGTEADVEELQRVTGLFEKGALAMPRVTEARRAVLLSSTRQLQTSAQLMQVTRQRNELSRQLEKLDSDRTINLLRELQEAGVALSGLRAKLQSIGEILQYTSKTQTW